MQHISDGLYADKTSKPPSLEAFTIRRSMRAVQTHTWVSATGSLKLQNETKAQLQA